MILEILVLLCSLALAFYVHITWNNNYWKKRGVPFIEPSFFFGNFKNVVLGSKHYGEQFKDLYRKADGLPLVGIYACRQPNIILRDPELIKEVMVSNFASFTDNDFTVDIEKDHMWGCNPFTNKGDVWKTIRARWVPHFTPGKVKLLYPSMESRARVMLDYLNTTLRRDPNSRIETRELATTYFTDSLIWGVFGIDINSFINPDNPFRTLAKNIFVSNFWSALYKTLILIAPWLSKLTRYAPKDLEDLAVKASEDIIRCQRETGRPNNDIYASLNNCSKSDGKNGFSALELAGRIFGTLIDGSETASGPVSFALFQIAKNPDIQLRLRNEIDEAVNANAGVITFDTISQMSYLDMVLSESLRQFPPLSFLTRVCTRAAVLKSGDVEVKVPVGMTLVIPVVALHMDPLHFPEPDTFDPERFGPDAADKITKFTYLPFGDGPRICIGKKLGILESKVMIVNLVRNYEIRVAPGQGNNPLKLDPIIFVVRTEKDLLVTLHPRKKSI